MDASNTKIPQPAQRKRRRRWNYLQFSLTSVVLVTVICAVAITWWIRRRDQDEIRALRAKAESLRAEMEFYKSVNELCGALDVTRRAPRLALEMLLATDRERFDRRSLTDAGERLDVAVFSYPSQAHPGVNLSGAILLRHHNVVDILIRHASTRYEHHEVKIENHDQRGAVEIVFHCQPANLNEASHTVRYGITKNGFAALTPDPESDGVGVTHGVD